jgi:ribonuclease III
MASSPHALERALEYRFRKPELLEEALTHSTYANEHADYGRDNERLEFVGDAVLGLLASRLLYEHLQESNEGQLSRRRAEVVRTQGLARLARELGLADSLRLGQGQRRAAVPNALLADAYEALAGAVFLDGGFDAVDRCFGRALLTAIEAASGERDSKTALQEWCQSHGMAPPTYEVVAVGGPEHARVFRCEVRVSDRLVGAGQGSSKKAAEQACAARALAALEHP